MNMNRAPVAEYVIRTYKQTLSEAVLSVPFQVPPALYIHCLPSGGSSYEGTEARPHLNYRKRYFYALSIAKDLALHISDNSVRKHTNHRPLRLPAAGLVDVPTVAIVVACQLRRGWRVTRRSPPADISSEATGAGLGQPTIPAPIARNSSRVRPRYDGPLRDFFSAPRDCSDVK